MFKIFQKYIAAISISLGAVLSLNAHAGVIKTDIVMIVDESGSMGTVQANLRTNIGLFASILSAGGIDASYALVGYGRSGDLFRTLTDFTDPSGFATAAAGLVASGGTEPAYDAVAYGLNSYAGEASSFSFRNDAVKNLIIFTDEPHNGTSTTFNDTDDLLTANNALFNAVLRNSSTIASIGPLATNNGGAVFDLSLMNTNDQQVVENFVADFANAKLQETIDFCVVNPTDPACINVDPDPNKPTNPVPAPPMAALFVLGLAGLLRKRV